MKALFATRSVATHSKYKKTGYTIEVQPALSSATVERTAHAGHLLRKRFMNSSRVLA